MSLKLLLQKLSIGISALAYICGIIAFFTGYWLVGTQSNDLFNRVGLWELCFNHFEYPTDYIGHAYNDCYYIFLKEYSYIIDWIIPITFIFLAISIFGPQVDIDRTWMPMYNKTQLGWSYYMAIISTILSFVAFVLNIFMFVLHIYEIEYEDRLLTDIDFSYLCNLILVHLTYCSVFFTIKIVTEKLLAGLVWFYKIENIGQTFLRWDFTRKVKCRRPNFWRFNLSALFREPALRLTTIKKQFLNLYEPVRFQCNLPKDESNVPPNNENNKDLIKINFILHGTNKTITTMATPGISIYDVVVDNEIDLDGFGACDGEIINFSSYSLGTLCCTTCHVSFDKDVYFKLPKADDEELDMLDLAFDLTNTSRLGCQVKLDSNLKNCKIYVPPSSFDIR
ncbi:Adrenodoxin, mitochondrial [Intoshia linei]|uniref:Adrenodoxin, mitochondrial n=1 Tax=Intoshia linei TaxID=1819745 RepID=A0A177AZC4_9BILA|nr:Adrenodoxin, mitochondrial [Intoshia linei]